jgi:hypothetical protein
VICGIDVDIETQNNRTMLWLSCSIERFLRLHILAMTGLGDGLKEVFVTIQASLFTIGLVDLDLILKTEAGYTANAGLLKGYVPVSTGRID